MHLSKHINNWVKELSFWQEPEVDSDLQINQSNRPPLQTLKKNKIPHGKEKKN